MVGWLAIKQLYINCFLFVITDFTTNYCGPYWSDGHFQSSIEKPKSEPINSLDAACKRHDIAYAKAKGNIKLLNKADLDFYNETVNNTDHPYRGFIYGNLVYYGNKVTRMSQEISHSRPIDVGSNLIAVGNSSLRKVDKEVRDNMSNEPILYDKVINTPRLRTSVIYAANGDMERQSVPASHNSCDASEYSMTVPHESAYFGAPSVPHLGFDSNLKFKYVDKRPKILFGRYNINNFHPRQRKKGVGARNMHRVFVE